MSEHRTRRFSQREGLAPAQPPLRPEEMPAGLRNLLWNALLEWGLDGSWYWHSYPSTYLEMTNKVCGDFFRLPLNRVSSSPWDRLDVIHRKYEELQGLEVYDFLDFLASVPAELRVEGPTGLATRCNPIFEQELAPVRFVSGILTLVTRAEDVAVIESAVQDLQRAGHRAAVRHLETSMRCLRQKPEADVRNSIKESISSVEAIARHLSGGQTLGDALATLRKRSTVPEGLSRGFEKLYGWTNGPDGIRHALLDEPMITVREAQFMLVACSGFVSYLLSVQAAASSD